MRDFIEKHITEFNDKVDALGGESQKYVIGDPVSQEEIDNIESQLGQKLPEDVKDFALNVAGKITFGWYLPDDFDLPENIDGIFSGVLEFDVSSIPELEEGRASWQKECFPNPDDSYDVIWHNKLGFHHVPNGDYLAFDEKDRVVYLSHDDGEGHGYIMADSFTDLIKRWLPLGCPGTEDWQWIPFVSDAESGISPDCDNAKTWMEVLKSVNTKPKSKPPTQVTESVEQVEEASKKPFWKFW